MNRRFGKNDIIFIGFLFIVCVATCVIIYGRGTTAGNYITITKDGEKIGVYSLAENREITIGEGEEINVIEVKDGKVSMKSASCPDHLCEKQMKIQYDMQSIICLPNKVVITINSSKTLDDDVDFIVQ